MILKERKIMVENKKSYFLKRKEFLNLYNKYLLYCNSNINYEFYRICSELPYTLYPLPIKNLVLMFTKDNSELTQLVVMTLPVYLYNLIVIMYIRRLFPWNMIWYNKYKSKYLNLRVPDNSLQE